MSFNEKDCIIPELWCGDAHKPPKKNGKVYVRSGTKYECMKKGFGAGMHTERAENLFTESLQRIKYVGEKHEENFKKAGIKDLTALTKQLGSKTATQIEAILQKILVKSDARLDSKAYNSTLLYLHRHGIGGLPGCKKIKL